MRKFPQPAFLVLGLSVVLGCIWTAAKDSSSRELDPQLAWHNARLPDRFVAVTRLKKGGLAASSTNGADWKVQRIICGFNSVTAGEGKFVAVGESGAVGWSTNGSSWRIISITTNELCTVLFSGECFLASGCAPVTELFLSHDGVSWKRHEITGAPLANMLDTWVTGTNRVAEPALTSIANEVRTLCHAQLSGK